MPSERIEIPFAGPAYKDSNHFLNAQECVNYFPEKYTTADGIKYVLRGAPGVEEWYDTGYSGAIRGMIPYGDYLYAACWDRVFRIDDNPVGTELSNKILTYDDSPVGMASGETHVMIVDGDNGYTIQGTTLSQITDSDFPGGDSVTYQDGFFVVNVPGTQKFNKSSLNDPTSWDGLDFSSEGWKPDEVVAVISTYRNLFIFGELTIVPWYNSGAAAGTAFPFSRREGTEMEVGCAAKNSVCKSGDILFWLGQTEKGGVQPYMATGFQPQNISTSAISERIQSYSTVSDAIGFAYEMNMHIFFELTFPTENETWVYDATEQLWHERRSWNRTAVPWSLGRHRVQCHAYFKGKHLVGDISNGKIYELKRDVYAEDGIEMPSIRTTFGINHNQDFITINELQVLFTPGQGLASGQGSDPKTILSWSYNGGITFENEFEPDLGAMGDYENRAIWWQLGQGRNWAIRTKTTDPINRDIWGAYANIEVDDA